LHKEKNMSNIEQWFSGKSLEGAIYALNLLNRSVDEGQWLKGASHKVRAALNKQNVAKKLALALRGNVADHDLQYALSDMSYGSFDRADHCMAIQDPPAGWATTFEKEALALVRRWAADWAPISAQLAMLDARRSRPVVVCKTLSPSVVANLTTQLGLDLTTVFVPPQHGEWREIERPIKGDRYGRTERVQVWHSWIEWPVGTAHNRSRFCDGSQAGNSQCHACGHAIKDPYNWCPLVAVAPQGQLYALWVGKDCARKLLECEVNSGEAVYENRV
jgi:hypothetical protein